MLLIAGSGARYREAVVPDAPAGYWRKSETSGTTATDLSGNGNHGTYVNSPGLGAGSLIAADGNASTSYTAASSHDCTLPGPSLSTNGSLEAWIAVNGTSTAVLRDHSASAGWFLALFSATNVSARAAGTNVTTSTSVASLGSGRHHYVLTKAAGALVLYLDGVSIGTASGAANTASTNPWHVARNGTSAMYSSVTVDEVAIYTTTLSATQVGNHYRAGR